MQVSPVPKMAKYTPNIPAAPSLATEIFSLMDALIARLGIDEYCKWLLNETPAAWVLDTPYAEIRDGLRAKASTSHANVTPAPQTAPADGRAEGAR